MKHPPAKRAERSDSADAFIPDPEGGPARFKQDDLAEILGEEFVRAATSGEDVGEENWHDDPVPEELGGPFVETTADEEMDLHPDASNPTDAEVEPLPRTNAGLISVATEEPEEESE